MQIGAPRVDRELLAACPEGRFRLALAEEVYSRKLVGSSMSKRIDGELFTGAIDLASERQWPQPGLVAPSDRGEQHASEHFQPRLAEFGMGGCMSRAANCRDNAPTESQLAMMKTELVRQTNSIDPYPNRIAAASAA
ncbi:MAG TPA: DDE-type integrase/transposase/recombinase [Pirellulales bacterium]|nr:DDE-type integrase/transposase/recombinase [Pirellulales bacterium]